MGEKSQSTQATGLRNIFKDIPYAGSTSINSSTGKISSDLASPIVDGRAVRFQSDISPTATYTQPAPLINPYPYYLWRVFDKATNIKVTEDFTATNEKLVIYPNTGKFRVECTFVDPNKGFTPALILNQDVISQDPALTGLLSSDSDFKEAEIELVNDFIFYINDAAISTGSQGITSRFLACILRQEIANTAPIPILITNKASRLNELSDVDTAIKRKVSGVSVPITDIDRSVGVGQIKLSTAAMMQGLFALIEQDPNNRQEARTRISNEFSRLSIKNYADLLSLLSLPKSNIKMAADLLAKLKNRSNRYPSFSRATFGANQRACEIIATEYNLGATLSTEPSANASNYGKEIWSFMSLPLMQKFFSNS
jgi:hypothetical protein